MTAYSAIADSEKDPESPFTATLATKYRDNPIAISEGSAGAPKIARIARTDVGRLVYISKATLSATTSAIFTDLDSTYDSYLFIVKGLYLSSSGFFQMQTSTDNGSTFASTNYAYHATALAHGSAGYAALVNSSDSKMLLTGATIGVSASASIDGEFTIIDPSNASKPTDVRGSFCGKANSVGGISQCSRNVSQAVNAVKMYGSAGNMTGEIILYGIDSGA